VKSAGPLAVSKVCAARISIRWWTIIALPLAGVVSLVRD
jgi:hypothetical protein